MMRNYGDMHLEDTLLRRDVPSEHVPFFIATKSEAAVPIFSSEAAVPIFLTLYLKIIILLDKGKVWRQT